MGTAMSTKIFVNLPVKDLERSKQFFEAIGFSINPKFSDETAACVVISEDIHAMILTHAKFAQFTDRKIADATKTTEALTALSRESRQDVDRLVGRALEAGASENREPQDMGFMYLRSISDPDGHIWEIFWMDPAAAEG
jgi:hypothetical protein